ncbi:MAG: VOC family protein [Chitinophagaceae bacterium]|jgi:catechol 2,3-dioxygenase-like lactoylglutathione lyase family enzyme|nr:VOC family protein [Chitinophagaceae bacterium]
MIALVSLVVANYDEAIAFYTNRLGFTLHEDTPLSATKRWVVLAPPEYNGGCRLLLAQAANAKQAAAIGNQTGGRVFLFLHTTNFEASYNRLLANNINFVRPPLTEPYGTVAVFEDLYGNLWDLIEPNKTPR